MADYKDTLHLPRTAFEMRANLAQKEPALLKHWQETQVYEGILAARAQDPLFVLHDGPPYANGHLHHGHILNKILKDMVVKYRSMTGYRAPYVPGWDCHGLPIEVQVDKELGSKKAGMSKAEIRQACRAYANRFVDIQKHEFERLGVFGRWHEPYRTMTYGYEAQTLRELATIVENGLVYKGLRPVNWCATHQTALAEAEVEYEDHSSPSIYVALRLLARPSWLNADADLVIWTTTPWTLPANLAVAAHPEIDYVAYPVRGRLRLVARGLVESFLAAVGEPAFDEAKVAAKVGGKQLEGLVYEHCLVKRQGRVLLGDHVTLEAGTGLVHIAPGHGAEDFDLGRRSGLTTLSPVDARGAFTAECELPELVGTQVFAANPVIVQKLVDCGALLNQPGETISHRYAHCWRCHKPIVTRATEQWWVALDKPYANGPSLRARALTALKEVQWVPTWGEDRIRGMLATRPDWCLSRQRTWGVPIAVVYCQDCGEAKVDPELMRKVAARFEKEGADAWFTQSIEQLVGALRCDKCGGEKFRKEEDILDVWFDSGVSFAAVVEREGFGHTHGPLVDLYLEGSDQHRGWFHSSLLCGLATRQTPPYRAVLTHGFVVDGAGKKISKSKGNFVDPFKAIAENGAEVLRLWVASEDYREDIRISDEILTRLTDTYRKIRNTVRFLLGNLFDFNPSEDLVNVETMVELDRYALGRALASVSRMQQAFDRYEFHSVVHGLNELCTVELSAFYLDVLKDRLYASLANSIERRSAQTALYIIARDLLRVAAPVLCFTADEAWSNLPHLPGDTPSIHQMLQSGIGDSAKMHALCEAVRNQAPALAERYDFVRDLRRKINALLEEERRQKRLGSSVEATVTIAAPRAAMDVLKTFGAVDLADIFIVSEVALESTTGDLKISVGRATGTKCPRCWLYRHDVGSSSKHADLCARCTAAL